jgi:uncharacterized membrane protein YjdF
VRSEEQPPHDSEPDAGQDLAERVQRWVTIMLMAIMSAELLVALLGYQWFTAFLVSTIMAVIGAPLFFADRVPVKIPTEFQVLAVVFIFGALFLGEIRQFYERVWWWDMALHATSGLLLGILGFMLVYVLNENRRVDIYMRPRFVAIFAFVFAVSIGSIWEIFEFGMDEIFGLNMQKPMAGDASGLTDTMWDMILNTLGALAMSLFGWRHMRRPGKSFMEALISRLIERKPGLFRT